MGINLFIQKNLNNKKLLFKHNKKSETIRGENASLLNKEMIFILR